MSYQIPMLCDVPIDKNDNKSYEGINYLSHNHAIESIELFKICNKYSHIRSDHKVLDFGCGTGRVLKMLHNICNVVGVDICKKYCDICSEFKLPVDFIDLQHNEYNPLGTISIKDYRMPYPNNHFDRIIAFYVFNHLYKDNFTHSFSECIKKLRKNGIMTMSCMLVNKQMRQSFMLRNDGYINIDSGWWIKDIDRLDLEVGLAEELLRKIVISNGCQIIEPIRYSNWADHIKYKPNDLLLIRKL